MRSFIRFKDFKNVDLPQPEGPISAVIAFSGILRLIFLSAWVCPYQRHMSFTVIISLISITSPFFEIYTH